jgi:hypothetical protein
MAAGLLKGSRSTSAKYGGATRFRKNSQTGFTAKNGAYSTEGVSRLERNHFYRKLKPLRIAAREQRRSGWLRGLRFLSPILLVKAPFDLLFTRVVFADAAVWFPLAPVLRCAH